MNESRHGLLNRYFFSSDHKVIGQQYYLLALMAVLVGMVLSWLMRIHAVWPNAAIPGLNWLSKTGAPGGVISPEYYLSLLTVHGTLMVFFVLTSAPLSAFGTYLLPLQIGARNTAFPRLNALSFWLTFAAFCVLISTFFVADGPPISGWTAYPPLSAVGPDAGPGLGLGQDLWCVSIFLFCLGALLSAINLITTTLECRTTGMTLMRMPLSSWAWFLTSCMSLLAFSVLLPTAGLLVLDRIAGTSFFVPAGLVVNDRMQGHAGGSPLLWQHLFWFFGHPEVYIALLPAMGMVSQVLMTNLRRPLLSSRLIVSCMIAIGVISFIVWGHHMFVSGMNPYAALVFSVPTLIITIPSTIVTLIWIGSIYGSNLRITTASLFCLGFISTFVSGGITGMFLAQPSVNMYLHATYFVVGHFHLVMGVAVIFSVFAGTYFWFPKVTGRLMSERLGKLHFALTFVGVYCIFVPFHYFGMQGNIRRYSAFVNEYLQPLLPLHRFTAVAALVTGAAQLIFLWNLLYSRFKGKPAGNNPWECTSLEWSISSPPLPDNFGGHSPVVRHEPDIYGGSEAQDYVMQNSEEVVR